ncbi:pantetheine-phosphate adenylyltransferase [Garciella nitratireducens]|uniref:Phosphopantetheine adenylyltransferase n=1 Tax=Garciella nitratireducens DSM 15102 TaxID=1121911 RepID=A0A1T4JYG5_9FIRM|nr:pantetheine-phosphate adenylyltransferase [Garciella nitratireducens]RBP41119.1 phosphopantetheine adenylyltransferase [Garciella nitratireducens]SJZ35302.1 Phosphopantetheine adenylyltransferase [Garciella nitratireducens DSM 15102]
MGICVYPGSFDPVTNGHLDIIQRASKTFDKVIVAVLHNPNKNPFFTVQERIGLLQETTGKMENVEIDSFSGLLIDFMKKKKANIIIKGLRQVSDFEYEFQMALMNKKLFPEVETMFMMTNSEYSYLSSSIVKEVAFFKGCIKGLVPEIVEEAILEKLKK